MPAKNQPNNEGIYIIGEVVMMVVFVMVFLLAVTQCSGG